MLQKSFFKQQKKNNPKIISEDNLITFNIDKKVLSEIHNCIVDLFNKNQSKKFKSIFEIQKFLNNTNYYKLKRNLNTMTKLEKIIYNYFSKLKIFNNKIKGIQFPIDLRIAHPKKPKQLKNKYLTSSIHCDTWTEEPLDIINVIIYLVVKKNTPKIHVFKTSNKEIDTYQKYATFYKNKFFLYSKKYFSILKNLKNKKPYKINHKNGEVIIFNSFIPHQTIREGNEVRLSLEFRLKTTDPYKNTDKWKKTNNHGRYMLLPNGKDDDFFQRIKSELNKIKRLKNFKEIYKLRKKEIKDNLIFKHCL